MTTCVDKTTDIDWHAYSGSFPLLLVLGCYLS